MKSSGPSDIGFGIFVLLVSFCKIPVLFSDAGFGFFEEFAFLGEEGGFEGPVEVGAGFLFVAGGAEDEAVVAGDGGRFEVLRREGNREYQLRELGPGEFFGEMAIFEGETRSSTVHAIGETWVYSLERDSLLRRIHEDPSLGFGMIQQMAYRIRELERSLLDRVGHSEGAEA